jgi:hypothetical protein
MLCSFEIQLVRNFTCTTHYRGRYLFDPRDMKPMHFLLTLFFRGAYQELFEPGIFKIMQGLKWKIPRSIHFP